MTADPIDISSILTDQGAILATETLATMLLWSAQTSFARETGNKDQIAFADLAMRLYAGALLKIDRKAGSDYLAALACLHDDSLEVTAEGHQHLRAIRADTLKTLREKLDLAARPAGGRC